MLRVLRRDFSNVVIKELTPAECEAEPANIGEKSILGSF